MEIKIEYDDSNRIIGIKTITAVEGILSESEKKELEKFTELVEKTVEQENKRILQETVKSVSEKASQAIRDISFAVSSVSYDHENQKRIVDHMMEMYDPSLDHLDLTGPKDETPQKGADWAKQHSFENMDFSKPLDFSRPA